MMALANHLWQSTLFVGLALALAFALRKNKARTRYWIWLIASVKFLIPLAVLVELGSNVQWRTERIEVRPTVSSVVLEVSQPFAAEPVHSATPGSDRWRPILLLVWAGGFLFVAGSWWLGWMRIHFAMRQGRRGCIEAGVPVIATDSLIEPGVFGIFRPVLLLPKGITEQLAPAHLEAIVAHELCHVRYRDNLAAAIHVLVQAIFWFHPLVWWLGVKLVEERERACDEEVLDQGRRPEIYAESILKTCQFYVETPVACMSGVTGADLKARIVRIMSRDIPRKLEFRKKMVLAAAGLAAVTVPLMIGVLHAAPRQAASLQSSQGEKDPSFDVASIKPNSSDDRRMMMNMEPSGRYRASGVPLKLIMEQAYGVKDSQIVGAPGWLASDRFDIEAKPDDATAEQLRKLPPADMQVRLNAMLRSLLVQRCKLAVTKDTKDLPVYALLVGKNGPKMHETPPDPKDPGNADGPEPHDKRSFEGIRMGRGQLDVNAAPMGIFADVLSRHLGRPVVDNTGLKGKYDFQLKWTPDEHEGQMFKGAGAAGAGEATPPPPEAAGPSIFTAVQEQLGLKLEAQKSPMQVLVIDHIEKPSAN